jgi:hypothetical protein
MSDISISKVNETYFKVHCDRSILEELKEELTFEVPGHKFSPKFKMKLWDGKISLLDSRSGKVYMGLISKVIDFASDREYSIELSKDMYFKNTVDPKTVKDFVDSLNIHSGGEPIEVRDYQYAAIYAAILNKRRTLLSPTASGKSLIIYCIIRWILERDGGSVLLLVPTVGLVGQMEGDFLDYSNGEFKVQTISAGKTKGIKNIELLMENGERIRLHGSASIKMINSLYKLVSELKEEDDIDYEWIKKNLHNL